MTAPARLSRSEEDTRRFGEALAPALGTGDVVTLSGPLGAGKTCFANGLARGLGCKARVRSPSFSLVNEYHGRILLLHLDLYRLEPGEANALGLEDYAERGALVVEWGEKLPAAWRADALRLAFEFGPDTVRRITAEAATGRGLELIEAWSGIAATEDAPQP